MNLLPATITTYTIVIIAFLFILIFKKTTNVNSRVSRKMTHIMIGPIYILTWIFYPENEYLNKFCAMSIVGLICVSMFICYIAPPSFMTKFLLETMSREGKIKELMEGPFLYGLIIVVLTIIYWNETPHGILSILILCLGDGMAEMIGMHGKHYLKAPFGRKTIEGCVSFIVFSLITCLIYEYIFFNTIWFIQTLIVVIVGCITEFVSPSKWDNLIIVLATTIACYFFNWN